MELGGARYYVLHFIGATKVDLTLTLTLTPTLTPSLGLTLAQALILTLTLTLTKGDAPCAEALIKAIGRYRYY